MEEKEIRSTAISRLNDKLNEKRKQLQSILDELKIEEEVLEIRSDLMFSGTYYLEQADFFEPNNVMFKDGEEIKGKYEELRLTIRAKIKVIESEIKAVDRALVQLAKE